MNTPDEMQDDMKQLDCHFTLINIIGRNARHNWKEISYQFWNT